MLSRIGLTLVVLLCLLPPCGAAAASPFPVLSDKTLVAWATVADRAQQGGSLLTIQEDEAFRRGCVWRTCAAALDGR